MLGSNCKTVRLEQKLLAKTPWTNLLQSVPISFQKSRKSVLPAMAAMAALALPSADGALPSMLGSDPPPAPDETHLQARSPPLKRKRHWRLEVTWGKKTKNHHKNLNKTDQWFGLGISCACLAATVPIDFFSHPVGSWGNPSPNPKSELTPHRVVLVKLELLPVSHGSTLRLNSGRGSIVQSFSHKDWTIWSSSTAPQLFLLRAHL